MTAVLDFGKYRGQSLQEIPDNYLEWCLSSFREGTPTGDEWLPLMRQEAQRRKGSPDGTDWSKSGADGDWRDDDRDFDWWNDSDFGWSDRTVLAESDAIDAASLMLFDRYLSVRDNWKEPVGFVTWFTAWVRNVLEDRPGTLHDYTGDVTDVVGVLYVDAPLAGTTYRLTILANDNTPIDLTVTRIERA